MNIIERHKETNNLGLERTIDLLSDGTVLIRGFSQDVIAETDENEKKINSIELQGGDYFDLNTVIAFDKKTVKFTGFEIQDDEFSELYSVVKIKCFCTNIPKKEAIKLTGESETVDEATTEKPPKQYTQEDLEKMSDDEIADMNKKEPGFFRKIMKNFT